MNIAYIGHSHHQTTRSTRFLIDLLAVRGSVKCLWDDSWKGGEPGWDTATVAGCDLAVVFQSETAVQRLVSADARMRIVFVPMFDSCGDAGAEFWLPLKGRVAVLCFCRAQYEQVCRLGLEAYYAQYFPKPTLEMTSRHKVPHGCFWWRRDELPLDAILLLARGMEHFHVHVGLDPGQKSRPETLTPTEWMSVSHWGKERSDYERALREADIVFAPRRVEGIGMTLLEAMAMGKAVAAPDAPTMNEYLTDGVTGYLYDPDRMQPFDFSGWREIGSRARESTVRGRQRWEAQESDLLDWMFDAARRPQRSVKSDQDSSMIDFLSSDPATSRGRSIESIDFSEHPNWKVVSSISWIRENAWVMRTEKGVTVPDQETIAQAIAEAPQSATLIVFHYLRMCAGTVECWRTSFPQRIVERFRSEGTAPMRRWPHPQAVLHAPGCFKENPDYSKAYHADRVLCCFPDQGPGPILRHLRKANRALQQIGIVEEAANARLTLEEKRVCDIYRKSGQAMKWMLADLAMLRWAWAACWEPVKFYGIRGGAQLLQSWLKRCFLSRRNIRA